MVKMVLTPKESKLYKLAAKILVNEKATTFDKHQDEVLAAYVERIEESVELHLTDDEGKETLLYTVDP